MHQMFLVRTTPGIEFKKRNDHQLFWIYVCGKLGKGNHTTIVTPSFSKSSFYKMFSARTKAQSRRFQINSSLLKNIFETLRVRDRLVWTVGLTVAIKLRF